MAKILIACPTKVDIDAEAAMAMANIDRCGHDITFSHADGRGVYGVAQARNRVAQKAVLDGDYDYLLTIDSDVIVPVDVLSHLLDPPAPIVLGAYRYKNGTGDAPFFKLAATGGSDKWRFADIPPERVAVRAAGLGCALIDTGVFRKLPKPWFHWDERPSGCHTGEDLWFCERARKAGYDIVLDGRVKCRHVGRKVYG